MIIYNIILYMKAVPKTRKAYFTLRYRASKVRDPQPGSEIIPIKKHEAKGRRQCPGPSIG
jgi:hypothetical protein